MAVSRIVIVSRFLFSIGLVHSALSGLGVFYKSQMVHVVYNKMIWCVE